MNNNVFNINRELFGLIIGSTLAILSLIMMLWFFLIGIYHLFISVKNLHKRNTKISV